LEALQKLKEQENAISKKVSNTISRLNMFYNMGNNRGLSITEAKGQQTNFKLKNKSNISENTSQLIRSALRSKNREKEDLQTLLKNIEKDPNTNKRGLLLKRLADKKDSAMFKLFFTKQ
jgi:hypothetical protein